MVNFLKSFLEKNQITVKILLAFVLIFIIYSNIAAIRNVISSMDRIKSAEKELEKVKNETAEIDKKTEEVKSQGFLEKEALDRFKLVKEPSTVLVVEGAKTVDQQKQENEQTKQTEPQKSNPEKWIAFFGIKK